MNLETLVNIGKKVDLMNNPLIGIIAEDDSDVECIKAFVKRMKPTKQIGFKKFVGHGCGKISRKANAWAHQFKRLNCNSIILLHDLDRNSENDLRKKINSAFLPSPIEKYIISIPIEELEAWLLSDQKTIVEIFELRKNAKLPNNPEAVSSPKEFLEDLVWKESGKKYTYLNTQHNEKIANKICIEEIKKKCPSFKDLNDFIESL